MTAVSQWKRARKSSRLGVAIEHLDVGSELLGGGARELDSMLLAEVENGLQPQGAIEVTVEVDQGKIVLDHRSRGVLANSGVP